MFSIDNHTLQIVSADFVPIHPYQNTSVLVTIGQRYNVIVEANDPLDSDGSYWVRAWRANCFKNFIGNPGYETTGILRYGDSTNLPQTQPWNDIALACSDETYSSLVPIVPWTVEQPANDPTGHIGQNFSAEFKGKQNTIYPLAKFAVEEHDGEFDPLQTSYQDPTILNLNYTGEWNPLWVVVPKISPRTAG